MRKKNSSIIRYNAESEEYANLGSDIPEIDKIILFNHKE